MSKRCHINTRPGRHDGFVRSLALTVMIFSTGSLAPGIVDTAQAQCTALMQTGPGSNAVAIAQRCGTTVGDLRRANPGRNLDGGALLNIPGGRTSALPDTLNNQVAPSPAPLAPIRQAPPITRLEPNDAPVEPAPGIAGYHVIRPGDTLGAIARNNGVPLRSLVGANPSIQPNRLQVGQRIAVPARSGG